MKILHTADWHTGRTLHGVDRTPEIRAALQEIAALAIEEQVDLILVAGDLYDSRWPGPEAEAAVYEFFLTTGQAGIPSVVIAGNHDHPERLEASRELLRLVNVHTFGAVRVAGQGGAFRLQVGGEVAQVAALPFISERRIVKVAELLHEDPGHWRERYQEGMRKLVLNLTQDFAGDTVNLLMMHTAMTGATLANSEYEFHCTEAYSLGADIFPEACNYVALGHI
ncbi:MAG TPA: exonuclease subunit SbcD, partial [Trueperaceae bacterium]